MFTGLVETIGTVREIRSSAGKSVLTIEAEPFRDTVVLGESISVNGVCLTVVQFGQALFSVEAVEETLSKTTLHQLRSGTPVNLERALKVGDRLGGHFVLGHVDQVARIDAIHRRRDSWMISVDLPDALAAFCIPVGSIAIDGISLTIARLETARVTVSVIPHTYEHTTLQYRQPGDPVNVEVDMIGKYVRRFVQPGESPAGITMETLRNAGFLS